MRCTETWRTHKRLETINKVYICHLRYNIYYAMYSAFLEFALSIYIYKYVYTYVYIRIIIIHHFYYFKDLMIIDMHV